MTTEWRKATVEDLKEILLHVSHVTYEEMRFHGLSPRDVRDSFSDGAHKSEALYVKGRPVAMYWYDPAVFPLTSTFITSGYYGRNYIAGVKAVRDWAASYDGPPLNSYTASTHPRVHKWFEVIGMHLVKIHGRIRHYQLNGDSGPAQMLQD